ncbi:class I adenylate-forming enzyme family protein [Amycolatopsis rhabdoformis]|uniref:Class I adenylate-forming enzyme family protein n=1 Tax=Amycolatopsis rhabdoformis TaxID=1448059 RepID=A0ABZ1ILS8_9PSEU|nr:class I adenylate-forming enzyme family protein [Amycolatopsis rhabdoformis]WSE34743.1 class I adenylate-forming enzyme family protein [Amycolatopsis rhabdoformis]
MAEFDGPARPDVRLVLPNLVRNLAQEDPDRIFLRDVEGAALSYGDVHRRATAWAASLRGSGVGDGDRVATVFATTIEGVIAWLACCYNRAISVPLNTAYRGPLLQHALDLTEPAALLVDEQFAGNFEDIRLPPHTRVYVQSGPDGPLATPFPRAGDLRDLDSPDAQAVRDTPLDYVHSWTDCPALTFTSGTTGRSKAVVLQWLQVYKMAVHTCKTEYAGPHEVVYIPWPLNHISGTGCVYGAALAKGVALLRRKWSTSSFMADVHRFRCTFTVLMGEMTRYVSTMDLPDGDPCPIERFYAVPSNPDLQPLADRLGAWYTTSYNSTEQSTLIVSPGRDPVPVGAAGKIRPGAEFRVVAPDGSDVEPGQVGELLTRTTDPAEMFAGYWNMPDATATATAGGWYHTGDAVRVDPDGYIHFLERMGDRLRHRGENVSPFDVEVVLDSHPQVTRSAVVGIPSVQYGEDDIVAFVVTESPDLDPATLLAYARHHLPKFMVPAQLHLTDTLPQTPTGKIQRGELRRGLLEELEK